MTLENRSAFKRIFRLQMIVATLVSVGLVLFAKSGFVPSLLFGVLLMAGNAWWLARRLEKTQGLGVEAAQRSLYAGAALRFVALIAALLLAFLVGLHLLVVAAGMFLAQMIVFSSALIEFKKDYKGDGFG
ncbi:MAG: ATP synthase subunit I [Mariprofundus sp.]